MEDARRLQVFEWVPKKKELTITRENMRQVQGNTRQRARKILLHMVLEVDREIKSKIVVCQDLEVIL